jgi:oligopeptide transport system ATP-binding protein
MVEKRKLLEVENLKQYERVITGKHELTVFHVDDVSFDVHTDEVFGMAGDGGASNQTIIRSIIRLTDLTDGKIRFEGKTIQEGALSLYEEERRIRDMRDRECFAQHPKRMKRKAIKDRARDEIAEAKYRFQETRAKTVLERQDKIIRLKRQLREMTEQGEQLSQINSTSNQIVLIKQESLDKITIEKALMEKKIRAIKAERRKQLLDLKADAKANPHAYQKDRAKIKELKETYDKKLQSIQREIKRIHRDNSGLKQDAFNQAIQMIFNDPVTSLDPRMTVYESVAEGLKLQGIKKGIEDRVQEVLKHVGLTDDHLNRYPHEFSSGQRQRISIARAIALKPRLLLADEPVRSLDRSTQARIVNLLDDLRKIYDMSIIFVSNDLEIHRHFSDRIAITYYGKLVELGPTESVFEHPLHPYTRTLMNTMRNKLENTRKRPTTYDPIKAHPHDPKDPPLWVEVGDGHFVSASKKELAHLKRRYPDIKKGTST